MGARPESSPYTAIPLTTDDVGELLTLQRAAYVSEAQLYQDSFLPALTQTVAELRAEIESSGRALGVRVAGRLVGAVRWIVQDGTARIGRLTVAPDLQGRGIGSFLLRAAEDASGVSRFELFTGHRSEANVRLYEREGYRFSRQEELRPGVILVFMIKAAK